jgi:hypothetical protein
MARAAQMLDEWQVACANIFGVLRSLLIGKSARG